VLKGRREGSVRGMVKRSVKPAAVGENDPTRPIANIVAKWEDAAKQRSILAKSPIPRRLATGHGSESVTPHGSKVYFTETPLDPHDPNSPTPFFVP